MSIAENLNAVRKNISDVCIKSGRDTSDIKIIGVTKRRTVEQINELVSLGVTDLGENRVQELVEKYDKIKRTSTLRTVPVKELVEKYDKINGNVNWHLIGTLQKNKVKYIADKVVMIHSVESVSLAQEIDKQCAKIGRIMDVLVQVNVSGEETKSGIEPQDAFEFVQKISVFPNIRVRGLMTMAPLNAKKDEISRIFAQLYQLSVDISSKKYDNISMEYLSMGMSNDYESAVEQGANIVRIGSALFK